MSIYTDTLEHVEALPITDGQERLKASSALREYLSSIAFQQHVLAESFLATGNEQVAARLFRWARELEAIQDKFGKIEGTDLHERLQYAQQTSQNILSAALAGLGQATKDKESK